ncbi:prepilin-type N-terminal cleavage/methylation domain-containing protein [Parelusimicrobium proximum]|uniref:type IV pilus modification PilV family protein n=1 Tax=Parelusimicrobium proximum TaxID=3228953 RepID=UPI003D176ECE
MIKRKIPAKKGFTIVEGIVAILLLAIVTAGVYGVILSTVRANIVPDIKEDSAYQIEAVTAALKLLMTGAPSDFDAAKEVMPCIFVGKTSTNPADYLTVGVHDIPWCMPLECLDDTTFKYIVYQDVGADPTGNGLKRIALELDCKR